MECFAVDLSQLPGYSAAQRSSPVDSIRFPIAQTGPKSALTTAAFALGVTVRVRFAARHVARGRTPDGKRRD